MHIEQSRRPRSRPAALSALYGRKARPAPLQKAARRGAAAQPANAMLNTFHTSKPEGVTAKDFVSNYRILYDAGKTFESFDQIKGTAYADRISLIGETAARTAFYNGRNTAEQRFFSPETEKRILKTGGVFLTHQKR